MSVTDEYLANNRAYAEGFDGPLPLPPSRHVAVVACMDARLDVYRALGLKDGEAHVIRNAGGVITDDEIRSLAISQRLLGTREIILIHHTDCGMLGGFNWSSQHLDRGGVQQWRRKTGPRRPAMCPRVRVGSGVRIGRCVRRCGRPGGPSPRGRCSGSSGV